MTKTCTHLDTIRDVTPSARGCEECLKTGSPWVHLRICRTCGHVARCCGARATAMATSELRSWLKAFPTKTREADGTTERRVLNWLLSPIHATRLSALHLHDLIHGHH